MPQECEGLTKEDESCKYVHDRKYCSSNYSSASHVVIIGPGSNEGFEDEEHGDENDWNDDDGERRGMPEFLFYVSGEKKVPPCTMNATEDGCKGRHEQGVQVLGMVMLWNI